MANNRLYIRCKQCGDVICIGKHFCDPLHLSIYDDVPFEDRLNEFYHEHYYCQNNQIEYKNSPIYSLELCEEFPGEMTDSHFDDENNYCPF